MRLKGELRESKGGIGKDLDVGEGGGQLVEQQVDARVSKRWRRGETCSQGRNKISLGNTLRQDWSEQSVHSSFWTRGRIVPMGSSGLAVKVMGK